MPDLNFYSKLFDKLLPFPRSITGDGYRKSLKLLSKYIPFKVYRFRSGKKIFDWTVPYEWKIKKGVLKNKSGLKLCDYKKNNISVMGYSTNIKKKTKFKILKKNIFTIKNSPNLIPYVTSYYKKNWGFCLPYKIFKKIKDQDILEAEIDSKFVKGSVDIGVKILKGKSKKTMLIGTYLCHPNMANNELSGPLVMLGLYDFLSKIKNRRFTYIFLINPETIGSLCFLHKFKNYLNKNIFSGLILTCLGGNKKLSYKLTKNNDAFIDRLFKNLHQHKLVNLRFFDPTTGSDERQYNSPGFNFPVGQISKLVYGTYKEYHTDGDNKNLMGIKNILNSINQLKDIISIIECAGKIERKMPYGEIFLSKHKLYPDTNFNNANFNNRKKKITKQILQILSYADGSKDIVDIANLTNLSVYDFIEPLNILIKKKIVKLKI